MRLARITLVVGALLAFGVAACDSGVTAELEPTAELTGEATFGKVAKVAVCHVGDTGTINLIEVPQQAADQHLGNAAHSFGDVSDYEPIPAGADGMGNEDTDGNGIDDGCEIPEEETIFAVAYTDVTDSDGGYRPGVDLLIAKLVDANGDGVVSPGDSIITGSYPTDFVGTARGGFGVAGREVTEVVFAGQSSVSVTLGDFGFFWRATGGVDTSTQELYREETNIAGGITDMFLKDYVGPEPLIFGDVLRAYPGSPSVPGTTVDTERFTSPTDDSFIDVEIRVN